MRPWRGPLQKSSASSSDLEIGLERSLAVDLDAELKRLAGGADAGRAGYAAPGRSSTGG